MFNQSDVSFYAESMGPFEWVKYDNLELESEYKAFYQGNEYTTRLALIDAVAKFIERNPDQQLDAKIGLQNYLNNIHHYGETFIKYTTEFYYDAEHIAEVEFQITIRINKVGYREYFTIFVQSNP